MILYTQQDIGSPSRILVVLAYRWYSMPSRILVVQAYRWHSIPSMWYDRPHVIWIIPSQVSLFGIKLPRNAVAMVILIEWSAICSWKHLKWKWKTIHYLFLDCLIQWFNHWWMTDWLTHSFTHWSGTPIDYHLCNTS